MFYLTVFKTKDQVFNTIKNILSIVLVILAIFQAPYFYYQATGLFSFLITIPYLLIALLLSLTLFFLLVNKKHAHFRFQTAALLIAITIGTATLSIDNIMEKADWTLRKQARNRIVNMIREGKIANGQNWVHLDPYTFPLISNGGNAISITKTAKNEFTIMFYIDPGFLEHYSAFIYTEDPNKIAEILKRNSKMNYQLEANWYRASY